jgi:CRP-like cAMP-binding protein
MAHLDQSGANAYLSLEALAHRGWLARQSLGFQTLVARLGRWRQFVAGEIVFSAGDEADYLIGLGEGILELTFPLVSDEPVVIHRAEPGFWTGDFSLIAGQTRIISISAATEARVFVVPAAKVRRALANEPSHWPPFYELSLQSTRTAVMLLAEALALSPRARVARILLRLAGPDGSVAGSQEDFARLLGMTRSSVRRALSSLLEMGALETGYGALSIRDRGILESLSSEA